MIVSPRDCLQARGNDCERIGNDCEPEGWHILHDCEPSAARVYKPGSFFLQAATYSTGRSDAQKKYATSFLENIGVRPFDAKAAIELRLADYKSPPPPWSNKYFSDLIQFISFWKKNPTEAGLFSGCTFLIGVSHDDKLYWRKPEQLCLGAPYLETGLATLAFIHKKYALWNRYQSKLSKSQLEDFLGFLRAVGVMHGLAITQVELYENPNMQELLRGLNDTRGTHTGISEDYSIHALEDYLASHSLAGSRLIWQALIQAEPKVAKARYRPNQQYQTREVDSQVVHRLKFCAWIPDKSGAFRKPQDMIRDDLRTDFPYDDRNGLLTAISFSENARKRGEEYQARNQAAQNMGFTSADEAAQMAELAKLLKENGQSPNELISQLHADVSKEKPAFPIRAVVNPERRQERLSDRWNDAPEKAYEDRDRSVRTTRGSVDPGLWLRNQYTNDAAQLICQICKEEMPFRKRDGEYYFEAVEALSGDYFTREYEAQYLALCPLCAAMYKEFIKHDETTMKILKDALMYSDEPEVPVRFSDLDTSIRFVESHLHDIRTILQGEDV